MKPKNVLASRLAMVLLTLGLVVTKLTVRHSDNVVKTGVKAGRESFLRRPNPILEVNSVTQHGDIFEIKGSVPPGVLVMINGESVPMFFEDANFRYFVGPLSTEPAIVTVTAQDMNGGVESKQLVLSIRP